MPTRAAAVVIDRLESRICFAAGPTVTNEMFLGPIEGATALVITFSGSLDPASAQNPANYVFGGSRGGGRRVHETPFNTPVYDDADHTVTLVFTKTLEVNRFKRVKVVLSATAIGGIADTAGNLLDGDRDGVAGGDSDSRFKIARGTHYKYKDADGDRVSLKLKGASGRAMTTLIGPNRNVVQVWLRGQNNTLEGSLRVHKTSNGTTPIGRVVLGDSSNASTLLAPFAVGQTVVDGQVPVDPLVVTLP